MTVHATRRTRRAAPSAALRRALSIGALALLASACASGPSEDPAATVSHVDLLVQEGQFAEAVQEAAAVRDRRPDDPAAAEAHRAATVAWRLARARRMTFEDRDVDALAEIDAALEVAPEHPDALRWRRKTLRKLADQWFIVGREAHASERFEDARAAYEKADDYYPGHPLAANALAAMEEELALRAELAEDYYNQGVRALSNYELPMARSRFTYTQKYDPESTRPQRRIDEVDRERAVHRASLAQELADEGLFNAAAREFARALELDPENEVAAAAYPVMAEEAELSRMLNRARFMILRGEPDRAQALLEDGLARTQRQKEAYETALLSIDDARAAALYQNALDLEHDLRYAEAIEKYAELLDERGFYEDARARMTTLQEYVNDAAALYEQVLAAEDPASELRLLRRIEVFWPEYRDIEERIERLEADAD